MTDKTTRFPKILILGHGRHGKDTVAEILRDNHGFEFISSSYFAAGRVMMPYFDRIDEPYGSLKECFDDRSNHRATWHQQIAAYNTPNKAKLPSEIMEIVPIYVGMRCDQEYAASRKLFDHVIWVDASARGIPEEPRDSFNITQSPEMFVVHNDHDIEYLRSQVEKFIRSIG